MHKITFISTIHNEIGNCNADELFNIIGKLNPEVIFLEALDETYTNYQKKMFSSFGIYHNKLEIKAIQKYSCKTSFNYIPVLNKALSNAFEIKYNSVIENVELQRLLDKFNSLASKHGFRFLNSGESIILQEEMRLFENSLLKDSDLHKAVSEDIDAYENSMIKNIYSYCRNNQFDKAIFMCGVAHRKSIIEKVREINTQEEMSLNWVIY